MTGYADTEGAMLAAGCCSPVPLELAPSRAYRELMYQPEGDVARWIGRHFDIVAGPGRPAGRRAQAGDVLLRVTLGRSRGGTCTFIDAPRGAPQQLGYGEVLLRPRHRALAGEIATAEDSSALDSAEGDPKPKHVVCAEQAWSRILAAPWSDLPLLRAVKILNLKDHLSVPLRAVKDLAAWTNSSSSIYVSPAGGCDADFWEVVLTHELIHIRQFHDAGDKRPSTWSQMIKYECAAYTQSAEWVARHPKRKDLADYEKQFRTNAKLMCGALWDVAEAGLSSNTLEEEAFRKFLIRNKFLPDHKTLEQLYK